MWTSSQTHDFNTITAHFIDRKKKCHVSKILDCSKFDRDHTAKHLADEIEDVCKKFGLDQKLVAALADKAANIKKAKDLIKNRSLQDLQSLDCYAHGLNSVFKDAFDNIPKLVRLKEKVKRLTTLTRKSTKAKRIFLDSQKLCGLNKPLVL